MVRTKFFGLAAILLIVISSMGFVLAEGFSVVKTITIIMGEPNFAVNGAYHELEEGLQTKAVMVDNKVISPLKDIIESIGGTFLWSAMEKKVTMTLDENTVEVFIDQTKALVNGNEKEADVPPGIRDGRIFLPVDFVMANLGCEVGWEKTRNRVVIMAKLKSSPSTLELAKGGPCTFASLLSKPSDWYGTLEAQKVADNILGFQNKDGGWIKLEPDVDMTIPIVGIGSLNVKARSTIDNDSTFTEMKFLAMVYNATKIGKYRNGFNKGLNYILGGQYPNGGWPQFFPEGVGYQRLITFNDNAMANILTVLTDIKNKQNPFAFVDTQRVNRCKAAYDKGLECILKAQIVANGKKTAWCAQYNEKTLEPAMGRAYELPSISGFESVKVVRFLMGIDNPSPQVIDAVQSAMAWFEQVKISGIKIVFKVDPTMEFGGDRIVVKDPNANLIWGRFYEIGTNKPIFSSRDSVKKYDLAEISYERRMKYAWYIPTPNDLYTIYPDWQKKWAQDRNVLQNKANLPIALGCS